MEEITKSYYPIGSKTLLMLVFKKSLLAVVLFAMLIFGIISLYRVPVAYVDVTINIIFGCAVLLLVALIIIFLIGWLQYFRYGIFVYEKDIKITRGLIETEEIGISYRRIKDVKIERGLSDQIFGLSNVIITMLDSEGGQFAGRESEVILPSLDKEIALEIQDNILKKSQVEDINVLP